MRNEDKTPSRDSTLSLVPANSDANQNAVGDVLGLVAKVVDTTAHHVSKDDSEEGAAFSEILVSIGDIVRKLSTVFHTEQATIQDNQNILLLDQPVD